ncbi:MAG TPA: DUF4260 domain-containing protein [Anaerolineales bacterium]|jgi:hypothetical protein|nr:DUF4260 domain-containing protein [Anaerolineales bacterium]
MKLLVRLEEFGLFLFSIYLFFTLDYPWWFLPLLLLAPDLSMIGYLGGSRLGAILYNLIHFRALALLAYVAGLVFALPALSLAGVIMFAHSSLDRAFGYGLKYSDSFNNTHLGRIGVAAKEG